MMQDFMDQTSHFSEGPEFDIGCRLSSPLMLSPTNEYSNPFFAMSCGDYSKTLILDLGVDSFTQSKPRLTPSEFTFSRRPEDFLDLDYFSLESIQLPAHPTRLDSASLASTTSAATPSEADSDFIERVSQDEELSLLHLDMASCSFPMSPNAGFGYQVGYVPSSNRSRRQSTQHQLPPSHASIALNTFNLSDFISDHEQEQLHGHHQQHIHPFEVRSNNITSSDRPSALNDVRLQALRSMSYSPASTTSPHTPIWDGGQHKLLSLRTSMKRDHDYDTGASINGHHGHVRPRMLMRAQTDSAEILSCNPSQITPNQAHMLEKLSEERTNYFYSMKEGHAMEQSNFTGDHYSTSPPSLYSSPTQEYHNTWSSIEGGEETKHEHFDGSSSPLYHHKEIRASSLDQPIISSHSQQSVDMDYFGSARRVGAMRNARLSAMAASRRNSMPYQSPKVEQTRLEILTDAKTIADMPGIITKRSRGRRVPSNPEELNNLGKSGKVYTCKVPGCGKCFKRSEHLKRHVRSIHTNEKPFTCHCGKTFSRHDNLNQHARVHALDGEDDSTSESAQYSPSTSPTSVSKGLVESQRGSFSAASSRLHQIVMDDEEEEEEDDEEEEEANLFAMDRQRV